MNVVVAVVGSSTPAQCLPAANPSSQYLYKSWYLVAEANRIAARISDMISNGLRTSGRHSIDGHAYNVALTGLSKHTMHTNQE